MITLPENPSQEELLSGFKKLTEQNLDQAEQIEKLEQRKQELERQLEHLRRQMFGQKRERFEDPNQALLPFGEDLAKKADETAVLEEKRAKVKEYVRTKPHPGREPLPENLPVVEEHIHPEGDLSNLVEIRTENTEILEIEPEKLFIRRIVRHIYADKSQEKVITPALPERINPKSTAGTSILAHMLVGKFVDHLPIHRQIERFKRLGYQLHANTAYRWMQEPMELLELLYQRFWSQMKSSGYLMVDETTIKSLESEIKGKAHTGRFWVMHDPLGGASVFRYDRTRSLEAAQTLLGDFTGYLQTDGYEVYTSLSKISEITQLGCWAHARRKFIEAQSNDKKRAEEALGMIQKLYAVEDHARKENLSHEDRKKLRLDKSLPVLHQFGAWILAESPKVSQKSAIGMAINYAAKRSGILMNYLLDGALEIDNNWIENKIRPVALGRKNYLFAGSDETAQHAAMMYSFFATCKRHDINEYDWLKFVLDNLPTWKTNDLDQLLPHNFKKLHA